MKLLSISGMLLLFMCSSVWSQEKALQKLPAYTTFKTTRIINVHSTELLNKRELDFRIGHRFDDFALGAVGLYGLEDIRDVRIGFEYGLSSNTNIGLGRSKGDGMIQDIVDGYFKWKLTEQSVNSDVPVSVAYLASTELSTMPASNNESSAAAFQGFSNRLSYNHQLLISRKFSDRISLEGILAYNYRDLVVAEDYNHLFAVGVGGRLKLTRVFGIVADYMYVFRRDGNVINQLEYFNPLAVGIEIETGAHVFYVNFSNSAGITESQFIPYTNSSWAKGEARYGFTIGRIFKL